MNTQEDKFQKNWEKNHAFFGQNPKAWELDFLYYIEANLPLDVAQKLAEYRNAWLIENSVFGGVRLEPQNFHITLALPGRLGTHFQKNDVKFMEKTLKSILKEMPPIPITIKNFNVFPTMLFAEIYEESARLQQLHETLCVEIPFSQHPEYRYQNFLPHVSLLYGGKISEKLTAETARNFPKIETELCQITFGKTRWKDEILEKPVVAEFALHE